MFRQLLRDWVCRHYGHHWWVISGTKTVEVQHKDNDTSEIHIYVTVEYGGCKRCGAVPNDPDRREVHTLTIHQPTLESFSFSNDECTSKFSQRIEQAP